MGETEFIHVPLEILPVHKGFVAPLTVQIFHVMLPPLVEADGKLQASFEVAEGTLQQREPPMYNDLVIL